MDLLERVRKALPSGLDVYLVGGATRDLLLGQVSHDLDFTLSGDVLAIARHVANTLGAAYYPLDEERDTARVVVIETDGSRKVLDFAALRGPDLESDLRGRDFTINALAVALGAPQKLIDPLGGAADLRVGALRACSAAAFQDDPLRILRGVRLAAAFNFRILPETSRLMRQAANQLPRISPERLRDELFRLLDGPDPSSALRVLDVLGALSFVLPELSALKGVAQSPPHISDVWSHTLDVLQRLENVLSVLALQHDPDLAANLILGLMSVQLGRYRQHIHNHLQTSLNPNRSLRALLLLGALYHDIAKPLTRREEPGGRVRFFEHDLLGAEMVRKRAGALHLSNNESERLKIVVHHHMRPFLLAQAGGLPTRRAIYRFFRDTGPAGVDVCLLSLADVLATYGPTLPQDSWAGHLQVVRALLEAWWEQPAEAVAPPALLDGRELMKTLKLGPGPQIGRLLDAIREAQATGEVRNRQEAFELAQRLLRDQPQG